MAASSGLMAAGATDARSAKTKAKRNIIISEFCLDGVVSLLLYITFKQIETTQL